MTSINSVKLYTMLQDALDFAESAASEVGAPKPSFAVWAGDRFSPGHSKNKIHFRFSSADGKTELEGVDFAACVEEYLRRCGFAKAQETLQIGHQTVEATSARALDDKIPF